MRAERAGPTTVLRKSGATSAAATRRFRLDRTMKFPPTDAKIQETRVGTRTPSGRTVEARHSDNSGAIEGGFATSEADAGIRLVIRHAETDARSLRLAETACGPLSASHSDAMTASLR
jgi:hypothetical protein